MKGPILAVTVCLVLLVDLPLFAAGDAAAGKQVYMKRCASCHGQTGEGNDAIAKMMKIQFTHLASKETQAKSDAELKKIPLEGAGKMKPVKDLSEKMAEDIVAFLRTLAKK